MPRVFVHQERCKGCGLCIDACPRGILRFAEHFNEKGYSPAENGDPAQCTGCALCARMCPDVAIDVFREKAGAQ